MVRWAGPLSTCRRGNMIRVEGREQDPDDGRGEEAALMLVGRGFGRGRIDRSVGWATVDSFTRLLDGLLGSNGRRAFLLLDCSRQGI